MTSPTPTPREVALAEAHDYYINNEYDALDVAGMPDWKPYGFAPEEIGAGTETPLPVLSHEGATITAIHAEKTPEDDRADSLPRIWSATDLDGPREVQWLIENRIPRGMVTVLVGDEGIGKSLYWVMLAVALTTGRGLPSYGIPSGQPQRVLLFLAENGWADMDLPRLIAAGADPNYIDVIATYSDGTGAGSFSTHIQHEIDQMDIKPALIVADPWLDTVPGNLNVKDGQQAKQAIRPWRETAIKHDAGVLLIAHTNRMSSASARDKYGATAELRKTARMTLYAQINEETGHLTIGPEKSNLVPPGMKADEFQIRSAAIDGFQRPQPVLEHVGMSNYTAAELIEETFAVAQQAGQPDTVDAKDTILTYLEEHNGTAPAEDVKKYWESKGQARPSWKTITNNRRKWGIDTLKTADGWEWFLPTQDPG